LIGRERRSGVSLFSSTFTSKIKENELPNLCVIFVRKREAPVIEDIKVQSRTWFSSCSIRFSRRAANRAAHNLARFGLSCNENLAVFLGL
jgi:hypothetical protein